MFYTHRRASLNLSFKMLHFLKLHILEAVDWSPEGGLCQPMQLTNRTVTQPGRNVICFQSLRIGVGFLYH